MDPHPSQLSNFILFMDHDNLADRLTGTPQVLQQSELELLLQRKQQILQNQSHATIEAILKENATAPIHVSNAQVTNGQAFRDSFLQAQLKPLLKSDLTTLHKLSLGIDEVSRNFTNAGAVKSIAVSLSSPHSNSPFLQRRRRPGYEIVPVFHIDPVSKFYAKTGTNIGNGEGDTYIQFQLRNIFGGGESLVMDAVKGTRTPSLYLVNYSQPIWNNPDYMSDTQAYIHTRTMDWIGASTKVRGITTKIYTQFLKSNHELVLENCWRSLSNQTSKSLEVLAQLGEDFKTSLIYNWKYDTRNNLHLPTSGHYYRLGLEYSGILAVNNVRYSKIVAETQHAVELNDLHSIIGTLKSGFIASRGSTSSILDRFYMGGPNDVRSFVHNGLGPKLFGSSIGGDFFVSGGFSLVSRLPAKARDSNFRLHSFVNAGHLALNLKTLNWLQPSVGCGIGILYNHPMARFELNVVVPLTAHERDGLRKGIQYGIGISFL